MIDPSGPSRLDVRLLRAPVVIAASLFLLALSILLWPVTSSVAYDGKFTASGSEGSELCGVVITQVFVVPRGDADRFRDKKIDCAAKARDLAGPAALFLLFAGASTAVALLTPSSSSMGRGSLTAS